MWVEFVVGSCPCSEGFSSGSLVFLPPQKENKNTFKFQFDPGFTDTFESSFSISRELFWVVLHGRTNCVYPFFKRVFTFGFNKLKVVYFFYLTSYGPRKTKR